MRDFILLPKKSNYASSNSVIIYTSITHIYRSLRRNGHNQNHRGSRRDSTRFSDTFSNREPVVAEDPPFGTPRVLARCSLGGSRNPDLEELPPVLVPIHESPGWDCSPMREWEREPSSGGRATRCGAVDGAGVCVCVLLTGWLEAPDCVEERNMPTPLPVTTAENSPPEDCLVVGRACALFG